MEVKDLSAKFSATTENRQKAIFSTLFIAGNRLQTLFDTRIPEISLKQFMLLSVVRHSPEPMTFTELGKLLGCSRQNIKKLAQVLERKGFLSIQPSPSDARALRVVPTGRAEQFFQTEFPRYERELQFLFEVYTEEEISTLFGLMTRLYEGIDNLAQKAAAEAALKGGAAL